MISQRFCGALIATLFVLLLIGCGESHDVAAVTGTVTYKGQPVEGATVAFHGANAKVLATGTTDASGKFKLTSYAPGDGAAPGSYKVTVTKQQLSGKVATGPLSMEDAAKQGATAVKETNTLPVKYQAADTTPLNAMVEKGKPNDIPLALTD